MQLLNRLIPILKIETTQFLDKNSEKIPNNPFKIVEKVIGISPNKFGDDSYDLGMSRVLSHYLGIIFQSPLYSPLVGSDDN